MGDMYQPVSQGGAGNTPAQKLLANAEDFGAKKFGGLWKMLFFTNAVFNQIASLCLDVCQS